MELIPDIPRIYTALAEWIACMVCIMVSGRRFSGWKLTGIAATALCSMSAFLILTENLPILFWVPCMIMAVGLMFFTIFLCSECSLIEAGYSTVHAFVTAEFAASLEWQLHCFFFGANTNKFWYLVLLIAVYGVVFWGQWQLEKRYVPEEDRIHIRFKELVVTLLIGLLVFAISNISFLPVQTPFSGRYVREIFNIRTIVDLGGCAVLFAYHIWCCDLHTRHELEAIQSILQNQYIQYKQSRESIELINYKYHDLKHQIAVLRAEEDPEKRNAFLNKMEEEIKTYEAQNKTGNHVLDILLTGKTMYCMKHGITLTCIADGTLLDFMEVQDICTIFGNALDNAIECELKIEDREKRLIHCTVSAQKDFLLISVENYYEGDIVFHGKIPVSTKKDVDFHGYGLKSIRYTVKKYNGVATIHTDEQWFTLKILIPLNQ